MTPEQQNILAPLLRAQFREYPDFQDYAEAVYEQDITTFLVEEAGLPCDGGEIPEDILLFIQFAEFFHYGNTADFEVNGEDMLTITDAARRPNGMTF